MSAQGGANTRTSVSLHRCPATGCTVMLPTRTLMCGPHWFSVPKPLRDEVKRLWKAEVMSEYWAARKAAVDACNAQRGDDTAVATG